MQAKLLPNESAGEAIIGMIQAATRSITILQYLWVVRRRPRQQMARIHAALIKAAARGVRVRILINSTHTNRADGDYAAPLREILAHPNIAIYQHPRGAIMHAKAVAADGEAILIGSHNFTERSLRGSLNLSLLITDHEVCKAFDSIVTPLLPEIIHGTNN
jgi:phosphatidylserine/phosphatidylglycerophosphate/cardiolipin synthase-like enzyme